MATVAQDIEAVTVKADVEQITPVVLAVVLNVDQLVVKVDCSFHKGLQLVAVLR